MPNFTGFDPKSLLTTTVRAKLDTRLPPFPLEEGDEFMFICRSVDVKVVTAGPHAKTAGEQYCFLSTVWECLDEEVKRIMHIEHPTAKYEFLLEVDPQRGLEIGEAKNVKLGRLLEAVGITSKEWSLSMIEGTTAYGKVKNRQDENNPEDTYPEITRMAASPKRK